jgi:hypothetical protein
MSEFDVKKYFEWFDSTKRLIEETPDSNLGWFEADLALLTVIVQTRAVGGKFEADSALADRFNRDGSLRP